MFKELFDIVDATVLLVLFFTVNGAGLFALEVNAKVLSGCSELVPLWDVLVFTFPVDKVLLVDELAVLEFIESVAFVSVCVAMAPVGIVFETVVDLGDEE